MSEKIRIDITYLDFDFQDELGGIFENKDEIVNLLDVYLSCPKMKRWCENFIIIHVYFYKCYFTIERTFQSDTKSTLRYIERDKTKKIVIDIDNIPKDDLLDKVKSLFKKIDELK